MLCRDEIYEISKWRLIVPKSRKETKKMKENRVRKCSGKTVCRATFGLPNAVNRGVKKRVLVGNESRECREYVDERTARNH